MEENISAIMLVTKRLAGVTQEVNLRARVTRIPQSSVNKTAHSGFGPLAKISSEVQNRGISGPTYVLQNVFKKFY